MANNIIDIITRLDYKTDTKGLESGYNALLKNIQAIDEQSKSVQRLEAVREKTDKDNLARLQIIDKAIENRKNKINQEINVMKGLVAENEKLKRSIEANVALYNKITKVGNTVVTNQGKIAESSKSATFALTNLSYVVQDLPFGFIGIANNVTPLVQSFSQLKAESGSTGAAFKTLLRSFMGPQGLFFAVSTITSLLLVFGDELFSTGKEADKAAESLKKYNDAIEGITESTNKGIIEETTRLEFLAKTTRDVTQSMDNRIGAAKEMQELYPDVFGSLTTEAMLNADLAANIDKVTDAIIARKMVDANIDKAIEATARMDELSGDVDAIGTQLTRARRAEREATQVARENPTNRFAQNAATRATQNRVRLEEAYNKIYELEQGANRARAKFLNDARESARELQDYFRNNVLPYRTPYRTTARGRKIRPDVILRLDTTPTDPTSFDETNKVVQASMQEIEDVDTELYERRQKRREENREAIIESAEDTANALIQIMESVSERQIQLLDYEIQIRQQRVQQAMELAKAGNAEILQQEQERLNKAQEEREKVARRQVVVNQALKASQAALSATQAIGAITAAAAETGVGAVVAVPAVIAILSAGFAVVSSLVNAFNVDSFKDGVVDYKGAGTETSDSNLVRISNRESVMTAEATKKYKPILMAMNENKPLPLPYTLELNGGQRNGGYGELKKEFQMLRSAFENSGIRVNTNVTNGHIATIVESEKRISGRTWN